MSELDHTANAPPHDAQAERALIGAALLDARVMDLNIDPAIFYRPAHETIWTTLAGINGAVDRPIALADALDASHEITRVGGFSYIHDCMAACISPVAAPQYAAIVQRHARIRRATEALTRAQQHLTKATDEDAAFEALEGAMEALEDAYKNALGSSTRKTSSWAPQPLDAVLEGNELDPPPTLMPRSDGALLAYAGAVHSLAGEPTSGKTWIALHAAAHELCQGNPVTYIDFEDRASRVVGRLLNIGVHPEQIRAHFRYIRPHDALTNEGRDALDKAITRATLTIIDGVTEAMTLHGLDLSSNPDIAAFYALLPRWVAARGPAVILIDHVVKDNDKQGRWGIGGQHKLAGLDGVAYIIKNITPFGRGKKGHSQLIVSKDRPGYIEEIALGRTVAEFTLDATHPDIVTARLDPPTEMPHDDHGDKRPTILMERVSRFIEITPGATGRAITLGVRGKADFVRLALHCLIQEQYVDVEDGPRGARHHHSITPFRKNGEDSQ